MTGSLFTLLAVFHILHFLKSDLSDFTKVKSHCLNVLNSVRGVYEMTDIIKHHALGGPGN